MITVPEATETVIKRSRYLSEALSKDIINISSLARYIKPEIEEMLVKKVSTSALIMSLKRLQKDFTPPTSFQNIFKTSPELTVRSHLTLTTGGSKTTGGKVYAKSSSETGTIMLTNKKNGGKETVSAVSIKLEDFHKNIPGVYYFFLKSLAWEQINILHVFSTDTDFTIVVKDKDATRTFGILKSLFEDLI